MKMIDFLIQKDIRLLEIYNKYKEQKELKEYIKVKNAINIARSKGWIADLCDYRGVLRTDSSNGKMEKMNKYYSQRGQDLLMDVLFNKDDGFFLDIGGNDPIHISNTYYFEKKGWTGLAFEPQQQYQKLWKEERKTECLPIALGEKEKEVMFYEKNDPYQSCVDVAQSDEKDAARRLKVQKRYKVQQRTLSSVLEERDIKKIDFVSMDVEGYEMNVLRGIDFHKVDISCFVIENEDGDLESQFQIRKFMRKHRYHLLGSLYGDDVFIKNSLLKKKIL